MQLNLARNILRKMPTGVPNGVIQLFLDRNSIGDIPKQVYSAYISIPWKETKTSVKSMINNNEKLHNTALLYYLYYGSHLLLFSFLVPTFKKKKKGYCAVLTAGCSNKACNILVILNRWIELFTVFLLIHCFLVQRLLQRLHSTGIC